jgi:hypothetical protein
MFVNSIEHCTKEDNCSEICSSVIGVVHHVLSGQGQVPVERGRKLHQTWFAWETIVSTEHRRDDIARGTRYLLVR